MGTVTNKEIQMILFQLSELREALQVNEDGAKYEAESLFESDDFQSNIATPVLGEASYAFKSIAEGTK